VCLTLAAHGVAGQPANLGDLKQELLAYHNYGGYEADLERVDALAESYIRKRAPPVAKPALVLDIDETALSNWPEITANDFGFIPSGACDHLPKGPCADDAWESFGQDEAIAPTLALFRAARAKAVAIFFITGRYEARREATERNLRRVGYEGWVRLIMRANGTTTESAADYKSAERKKIEDEGYTIVANVGDQPSDLAGGHAERAFLLPDPFYRIP
jgi:acid phosphatase